MRSPFAFNMLPPAVTGTGSFIGIPRPSPAFVFEFPPRSSRFAVKTAQGRVRISPERIQVHRAILNTATPCQRFRNRSERRSGKAPVKSVCARTWSGSVKTRKHGIKLESHNLTNKLSTDSCQDVGDILTRRDAIGENHIAGGVAIDARHSNAQMVEQSAPGNSQRGEHGQGAGRIECQSPGNQASRNRSRRASRRELADRFLAAVRSTFEALAAIPKMGAPRGFRRPATRRVPAQLRSNSSWNALGRILGTWASRLGTFTSVPIILL